MIKVPTLTYVKLLIVAMCWGGTFIAGRLLANHIPPMIAAALRFAIASAVLLPLAWQREGGLPKLTRAQMQATFALGATGIFLYNICFFSALEHMVAGRTALFVAVNPIVTALALATLFGERLGGQRWAGIGIAFIGAAIVITRGDPLAAVHDLAQAFGPGEVFMSIAICAWAAYTIIGRHALTGLSPLAATTYAALWGLLLLSLGASTELTRFDSGLITWPDLAALAYLGIFGTVLGFVWYYEGVKAIGPSRTAVFNNLVPVFGISFAAVLLGEPILISMLIGGALVIGGVALTNRK
ncbi:DMT family transporter [Undibacterium sp. CCC2.1]|uniref:DMT family transporter n=2 Tax=Undibacterium TaxID=401469 RepID=UPI002B23E6BC|nr:MULTISPECIES: DMT family transporter [unclassified Undibacterium]MEB0138952.1 DMT family transporter [Undibacterium sp. CCC2.1]MEB0171717.1 DMT family transporter [Undibacterium sp. CCC1.1]MEB0175583.1 DMT family transporter [Undibacterium sp. CCC3.4]MEB0214919.1 DMT family transporter [Undibacterium sp. 5I2]